MFFLFLAHGVGMGVGQAATPVFARIVGSTILRSSIVVGQR